MVTSDNSPDAVKIRHLLQRSNTMVTQRKKCNAIPTILMFFCHKLQPSTSHTAEFKSEDISQDLGRLLKLEPGTSATTLGMCIVVLVFLS